MNGYLIHHSPTKKIKQDLAHSIFYCEFGILSLVWQDFKEPIIALHMHLKHAHSRFPPISIDLRSRFKYT